jgi:hypothetical protein
MQPNRFGAFNAPAESIVDGQDQFGYNIIRVYEPIAPQLSLLIMNCAIQLGLPFSEP